ncbi:MAG TPA: EAL domain-containing protein [Thermoanaerobaculia bacterium]|nr:EAL domain-containing protein [Thermoanaerobaculia bacterium]
MPPTLERLVFPPGTPVFREGEPGDCAYVIERGRVEITALRGGRPVRLALLGERELFGEMALVDDRVRSATATALEETEVVLVPRERIREETRRADPLLHLLLRVTLDRLRETSSRVGPEPATAAPDRPGDAEYEAMRERAIGRIKLEQELRRAPATGELELWYQPIVALAERSVAGYEALLRWRHPARGLLGPGELVPVAEETGAIVGIGRWVLETACAALAGLAADGSGPGVYLSVNLSAKQLAEPRLAEHLAETLRATAAPPERLVLESTESALMDDPDAARATLARLRDLGARLYLDDFGTGYSSLSYLHRFPLSGVKLDRSFVASMLGDPASAKVVRAVAGLAHQLELGAVAEGIEEEAQAAALTELGFEHGQGYLFARPGPDLAPPG